MAIRKLSEMAACRQLGFDVTRSSAIQSADPENPTLEPNMKCIGSPVAEIWSFAYLWGIWNPILVEGEVVVGQRCLRHLNQQGVDHLGQDFRVFP